MAGGADRRLQGSVDANAERADGAGDFRSVCSCAGAPCDGRELSGEAYDALDWHDDIRRGAVLRRECKRAFVLAAAGGAWDGGPVKESVMRKALCVLAIVLGVVIVWKISVDGLNATEFAIGAAFAVIVWELARREDE